MVRLHLATLCQWVLAYRLILNEKQRIAFLPIAFVGVCPYLLMCVCIMYVCVCVCVRPLERFIAGPHENRLR